MNVDVIIGAEFDVDGAVVTTAGVVADGRDGSGRRLRSFVAAVAVLPCHMLWLCDGQRRRCPFVAAMSLVAMVVHSIVCLNIIMVIVVVVVGASGTVAVPSSPAALEGRRLHDAVDVVLLLAVLLLVEHGPQRR